MMTEPRFRVGQAVRPARRFPSLVGAGLADAVGRVVGSFDGDRSGKVYVLVAFGPDDEDDPWVCGDDDLVAVTEGDDG